MNHELIRKAIQTNNEACPMFTYGNPLLERSIAKALSKSFVRLLKVSSQNGNSNCNLRLSVLKNIRKMCQVEPANHLKINESFTELLTEVYEKNIKDSVIKDENATNKVLDAFLIRKLIDTDMDSNLNTFLNPEIAQALVNLNESGGHIEPMSKELIHWRSTNSKCKKMLDNFWHNDEFRNSSVPNPAIDDISLKMKAEIEILLLQTCHKVLENRNIDVEGLFTTDSSLLHLIKTSAVSATCFQICSNILNILFIQVNFDDSIEKFIAIFVNYVKLYSLHVSFSTLYPSDLSTIALLMDIDINDLPTNTKTHYLNMTINLLKTLHEKCENNLILVLSHFPDWFNLYFVHI